MMLPGMLDFGGFGLDEVARVLSSRLDRPVIDKTGVDGTFNVHLEFARDETAPGFNANAGSPGTAPSEPSGPSIFAALEQLGLKLESTRGPRQFLVIDRVEKPTPN
jgi:uncharacterized protein (TIGR03435 family)